mmetsp:Transcript_13458/g.17548  ORF Transcript_13458/g.17548 Transcript_13458/m.17548 type:complete len:195 (+) Transcript_13458:148-732(+)|eukprot:CAMPEP_0198143442 /NCGR_PEP_ID=MMETSP1443-20131203/7556_1 /TAXON_ID=186043 /ORGANISM="Entomoneis sp., Strain CCMP2396" /LENGTH=194 /DNA_ID=CAMNT_0043806679 /DNA_START=51 /DNA_END=635 /DNA_ORIENTATION=-
MKGLLVSGAYMLLVLVLSAHSATAFGVALLQRASSVSTRTSTPLAAFGTRERTNSENKQVTTNSTATVEEDTENFGLEVGLFKSLQKEDGGESAKSLLKKYGIAYLATSIPLAIVSFTICYLLVDNGVDVSSLLSKVGIQSGDATEKVGTFAIAYGCHKAASPIRFPPTVILTPIVAKLIGKEPEKSEDDEALP